MHCFDDVGKILVGHPASCWRTSCCVIAATGLDADHATTGPVQSKSQPVPTGFEMIRFNGNSR